MTARPCPACESPLEANRTVGHFPPTFHGRLSRPTYDLVECDHCNVVYLAPPPSNEDLRQLYVETDQFDQEYVSDSRSAAVGEYMDGCFRNAQRLANATSARVLEIGAGPAWMCAAAKRADSSNFTVAQDVSPEMVERCPWADKYVLGEIDLVTDGDFDIASMTHVIEHLVFPVDVLRQVRDRLRPGGVLFVSAPFRPQGWESGDGPEKWLTYSYHHVPGHVQYFSKEGLGILAAKAGFRLEGWDPSHDEKQAFEAYLVRE